MRWTQGEATVQRLIRERRLQQVAGAEADGKGGWSGQRAVKAAHTVTDVDPDSAYVLAYDAARQACTSLDDARTIIQAVERLLPDLAIF